MLIGGFIGYNYIYQNHRNISTETAEYTLQASDLISEFLSNTEAAQAKYLNKTISIQGTITSISDNAITLNNSIFCSLLNSTKTLKNDLVSVKGRFIGYDDLLEEIKLDQCTITETN